MKRAYIHAKKYELRMIKMQQAGNTRREIAEDFGVTKEQVKECIKRYRQRIAADASRLPKVRGRKPAVTLEQYKCENKRLRMENELLRDFLHLAGRG